ncbi:hypothetical protein BDM02DRAFT_1113882 [Thelephora ganbajun]|uniref:Uncharacterized protein n=1 Tax=Thelephora ganbajun TaxID=370292 RepID=A0ACB6ZWT7_THEGA|nr:hypothetical protein BDM02DRAFT_1113882 [Thelephora ganbajun]
MPRISPLQTSNCSPLSGRTDRAGCGFLCSVELFVTIQQTSKYWACEAHFRNTHSSRILLSLIIKPSIDLPCRFSCQLVLCLGLSSHHLSKGKLPLSVCLSRLQLPGMINVADTSSGRDAMSRRYGRIMGGGSCSTLSCICRRPPMVWLEKMRSL